MLILSSSAHGDLIRCAKMLANSEVVAIPTETVYGLAANALDTAAVEKIFKAKNRPADNPLIIHISKTEDFAKYCYPDERALLLAKYFWPGPLTVILKRKAMIPDIVTAGLDSVAVRMPSHPVAREIISLCGFPLAAPSANISGTPSPSRAEHVIHDFDGNPFVSAVVDGGVCSCGLESTVVSLVGDKPCLLRPGFITPENLRRVLPDLTVADAVLNSLPENEKALSPGLKHRHYAPKAQTVCLCGDAGKAAEYIARYEGDITVICFNGEETLYRGCKTIPYGDEDRPETLAENLFDALRRADASGSDRIFVRCVKPEGIGMAVYNRLLRASSFNVITL